MKYLLLLLLALPAYAALPAPGTTGAPADPRYCGEPARDATGRIVRSSSILSNFKAVFPCPLTLKADSTCPGWQINHTLPLATGGCDSQINLMWLPVQIKTCADPWCVDRWERRYHAIPRQPVVLP